MAEAVTLQEIEQETAHDTINQVLEEFNAKEEPSEDVSTDETESASDRERDELGRFKSKEAEAAEAAPAEPVEEEEEPAEEAAAEPTETEEAEPEVEASEDTSEPPAEWTVDQQKAFMAVPEEHRKPILEALETAKEDSELAEQVFEAYEGIEKLIQPRREAWSRNGMSEQQALTQLFALSDWATTNPVEFARHFITQRSIPAGEIFDLSGFQKAEESADDYGDPDIKALRQTIEQQNATINQLHSSLNEVKGGLTTQQQAAQQSQAAEVRQQIDSFRSASDETGKQLHPYFGQVEGLMTSLIQSGQANDLQHAYDMACRAHPDVHAKISLAQENAMKREQATQARKKAEAAKKAGSSVTGTPGGGSTAPAPTGDIREDMRAAFAERGAL